MSTHNMLPNDDMPSERPSAEARREVEALATLLGTPDDPEPPSAQALEAAPEPDDVD